MSLIKPQKKDWRLMLVSIFVIALLGFVIASVLFSYFYVNKFKSFAAEIEKRVDIQKPQTKPDVTLDGTPMEMKENGWDKFKYYIREMKPGKTRKDFPGDEQGSVLEFRFHNNDVLEICEAPIKENQRRRDEGICMRYTKTDGTVYLFDTDQFGFNDFKLLFVEQKA